MISLDEAQDFIRQSLTRLAPFEHSLEDALGCVAAQGLVAKAAVPSFSNSAMDGYALKAIDTSATPVRLRVIGSVMAGELPAKSLGRGEVMRIMTGAPVPDGADCVCKIEEVTTDADGEHVTIGRAVAAGENVRFPGEDIVVGQVLVAPGSELGPVEIGVLASQGLPSVLAYPRPRVGVLSTGDELTDSLRPLRDGKIRDINRPMLLASLRQAGYTATDLGIVRDEPELIREAFQDSILGFDAVISTGGVSVGDVDHVKTVIVDLCGSRARSMQIAIKPGKPLTFGVVPGRGVPIFGLPGNPVSTLVGFELWVRPSLRLLGGHRSRERPTFDAVLDCPLSRRRDGKIHLVHVTVTLQPDGRLHITSVMRQGSHLVSAIAGANAIAMVPDGEGLESGQSVRTMVLDINQTALGAPSPEV